MKEPKYSIKELEVFLLQKKAGHSDLHMEQQIEGDPFLQTILVGLEKTMANSNNNSTTNVLAHKKHKNWSVLAPALSRFNNTTTNSVQPSFLEKVRSYFSIESYDPQYLRIHLLLSFNCSCVLALIVAACWLNSSQETQIFVAHLESLAGYKP